MSSAFPQSMRLPVIAAPMFLVSGPELVIAACKDAKTKSETRRMQDTKFLQDLLGSFQPPPGGTPPARGTD